MQAAGDVKSQDDSERLCGYLHIFCALYEKQCGSADVLSAEQLALLDSLDASYKNQVKTKSLSFAKKYNRESAFDTINAILANGPSETLNHLMTAYDVMFTLSQFIELSFPAEIQKMRDNSPTKSQIKNETVSKHNVDLLPVKKTSKSQQSKRGPAKKESEKPTKKRETHNKSNDKTSRPSKGETKKSTTDDWISPKHKKETDGVKTKPEIRKPAVKRKNRKSSSSEDSIEEKKPSKKQRTASTPAKKERTAISPAKKETDDVHILRDGCLIKPLFIKEGQKFSNFLPSDVDRDSSSVFTWSVASYNGDPSEINIYDKKIVFTQRWFAIDVRKRSNPQLKLKPVTKTEMKNLFFNLTDVETENQFLTIVKKFKMFKDGANSDQESEEAKLFMRALRRKKRYFSKKDYYMLEDSDNDNDDSSSFLVRLTKQLPKCISNGSPLIYDELSEYIDNYAEYKKHDFSGAKYVYDKRTCIVNLPSFVDGTFKNVKKLETPPLNGFITPSSWYFDTEAEFLEACAFLSRLSASISDINVPIVRAKRSSNQTTTKKTKDDAKTAVRDQNTKKKTKKTAVKKQQQQRDADVEKSLDSSVDLSMADDTNGSDVSSIKFRCGNEEYVDESKSFGDDDVVRDDNSSHSSADF